MDVDELYGLPLDEFVPARNALARELKGAGEPAEAAEVAALRKPSVAAWAVNQLVRTQRRGVGEPPEGRYTRDRAKPDFWWRQRPVSVAAAGIVIVVIVIIVIALLR